MRSPLARWKVRHLFGAWLGYWAVLAVVALTPAAIAMWKVTRDGAKGNASINAGDGVLHAIVAAPSATLWEGSVSLTTLVLAVAGPPLVLWVCWLLSASRDPAGQRPAEQLGSGDELPLRDADRSKDAIH